MDERLEEIQIRKAEIKNSLNDIKEVEKINELNQEVDALNSEEKDLNERKAKEISARELEQDSSKGQIIIEDMEERKMNNDKEIRNSKKYIDAYAEYIKTGKDEEVRSLLSTNVTSGTIAVPDFIYETIKTAWDTNDIMSLVTKAELKGNLKVQFEITGSDGVVHTEGSAAAAEGTISEGIVTIVPKNIMKWISISDEVMALRGEAFLSYVYSALTHRIVKKAADQLVSLIKTLPATATEDTVSANKVTLAPSNVTISTAIANLSDEASKPVVIVNKLTYANFKKAQYDANYGIDIFEGLDVKFNNSLPAYDTADEEAVYGIVGDLGQGALANFPNGTDTVDFKFDELSRKKEGLVEILGKQYIGLGLVADKAFALLVKPKAATQAASSSTKAN